jgi:hypothetical protein
MLLCAGLVWLIGSTAGATLVIPPTLDDLVSRADVIFEGSVVDVRSEWRDTRDGRVIMSAVTFRVLRSLKGDASAQMVLDMFGGTVGKDTMRIAGMTEFRRGDRDVLFVRRGTPGLPLVGLMHGRFHVTSTPDGREMVTTFDGRAINGVPTIGTAPRPRAEVGRGMTLDVFSAEVAQRVRTRGAANR